MSADNSRDQDLSELLKQTQPQSSHPDSSDDQVQDAAERIDTRISAIEQFWDDAEGGQVMINQLLAGTFDERIQVHAENIADRLLERQRDLDRREVQLAHWAAELENQLRQVRLQGHDVEESELAATIVAELAGSESKSDVDTAEMNDNEFISYRLDRYCKAQRLPYSDFNVRLKKYTAAAKSRADHAVRVNEEEVQGSVADESVVQESLADEPVADESVVDESAVNQSEVKKSPGPETGTKVPRELAKLRLDIARSDHGRRRSIHGRGKLNSMKQSTTQDELIQQLSVDAISTSAVAVAEPAEVKVPVAVTLERLSAQATKLRLRGEAIDAMHEDMTGLFSEMLRQHGTMRQIIKALVSEDGVKAEVSDLAASKQALDRMTIQLTQIGRKHFHLSEGSEEAA